MEKILITGASGFIGSHVAAHAKAKGFEVYELSHKDTPLQDKAAVEKCLDEVRPDAIFHLATSILMSGKVADPHTLIATNVEGAINLMEAAAKFDVGAFINTGTFAEYGPKGHPVKEDELCTPLEIYAMSKLASTVYAQGLAKRTGFPAITLRLFTPYGSRMREKSLVMNVLSSIKNNKPIMLTQPSVARDFIYVGDVAEVYIEAIEKAEEKKGEVFNVGSGEKTSLQELVDAAAFSAGIEAHPRWGAIPVQSYDSDLWQADMEKTFSHFAWRPRTPLEEGIRKTLLAL